eukprot:Rhum_TRINITY_DN14588_c19_g1::Rhum_TRINITY_DN14588_c19_g1_i1::g.96090::m.96090
MRPSTSTTSVRSAPWLPTRCTLTVSLASASRRRAPLPPVRRTPPCAQPPSRAAIRLPLPRRREQPHPNPHTLLRPYPHTHARTHEHDLLPSSSLFTSLSLTHPAPPPLTFPYYLSSLLVLRPQSSLLNTLGLSVLSNRPTHSPPSPSQSTSSPHPLPPPTPPPLFSSPALPSNHPSPSCVAVGGLFASILSSYIFVLFYFLLPRLHCMSDFCRFVLFFICIVLLYRFFWRFSIVLSLSLLFTYSLIFVFTSSFLVHCVHPHRVTCHVMVFFRSFFASPPLTYCLWWLQIFCFQRESERGGREREREREE